jgi:hypothetical protein
MSATLVAGAVGKCSVPMWQSSLPAGLCGEVAYGQQYSGRRTPPRYSLRRRPYAPLLCCKAHGGPGPDDIRFMRDGNMWCAFMPGFENLQESVAGFGATQDLADDDLRQRLAASCDTHPKGGDATQIAAPFMSGAVPAEERADAQPHPGSKERDK